MSELQLRIGGMHCVNCAGRIEKELAALDGVEQATINFASETLHVDYNAATISPEMIAARISGPGYLPSSLDSESAAAMRLRRSPGRPATSSWCAAISSMSRAFHPSRPRHLEQDPPEPLLGLCLQYRRHPCCRLDKKYGVWRDATRRLFSSQSFSEKQFDMLSFITYD